MSVHMRRAPVRPRGMPSGLKPPYPGMMGTVRWESGSRWSIRWWVSAPGLVVAAASVVVLAGRFTAGGTTITGRVALVGALSIAAGGVALSPARPIGPRDRPAG